MPIIMPIISSTSLNLLLNHSINQIQHLQSNVEFIVEDLFLSYEWKQINKNTCLQLREDFSNFAKSAIGSAQIRLTGETPLGQKIYVKI